MMAVYVDELRIMTTRPPFHRGSCHLTADSDEELHALADKIGLKRSWFQPSKSAHHYDLTPSKREEALAAGATFVPAMEQARKRIAERRAVAIEEICLALKSWKCIVCSNICVCWGNSEGGEICPMCDDCCGHGGEDGWCTMAKDEGMAILARELYAAGWRPTMGREDVSRLYKLAEDEGESET